MKITKAIVAAVAAAFLVSAPAHAAASKIKKTELPQAVREAADREAQGGHIVACWRNVGDRAGVYEVDLKVDGHKKGLVIAADGEVLRVQEQVTWEALPPDVQASFRRQAGDHDIEEVHSLTQGGEIVGYFARIDGEGVRDYQFGVGPHGEALGHDEQTRFRDARGPEPNP
jgi:hypothetical protein